MLERVQPSHLLELLFHLEVLERTRDEDVAAALACHQQRCRDQPLGLWWSEVLAEWEAQRVTRSAVDDARLRRTSLRRRRRHVLLSLSTLTALHAAAPALPLIAFVLPALCWPLVISAVLVQLKSGQGYLATLAASLPTCAVMLLQLLPLLAFALAWLDVDDASIEPVLDGIRAASLRLPTGRMRWIPATVFTVSVCWIVLSHRMRRPPCTP